MTDEHEPVGGSTAQRAVPPGDHRARNIALVVAAIVAVATIAFLVGRASQGTDDATPPTGTSPVTTIGDPPGTETTIPSSTTSSTTTATSATPTVVTSSPEAPPLGGHLTNDGSEPTALDCEGLAGVCLASPLEVLTEDLGPPNQRYAGPGPEGTSQVWELSSARLTVTTDAVDAVTAVTLSWPPESMVRASVGGGGPVVGSHLTLADIAGVYGGVGSSEYFCGENAYFADFTWQQGPEGSITVSYGTSGEGCPDDPGTNEGRLASFGPLPPTSTTVN